MSGIFKAYDIRGVCPDELDEEIAFKIGRALGQILNEGPLALGRDMRLSSPRLAASCGEGIRSSGIDVVDVGMISTPADYFAIANYDHAGGAMVTASHNPARYNGFKLSGREARPVGSDSGLAEIEKLVDSGEFTERNHRGKRRTLDIADDYRENVLRFAGDI